ncbi:hypothetical protein [Micromonospora lupini]|uniref:hypothetical protein n=1 Tax=Micromonospora lupini TaxID=285679 RepID=UPI0033F6CA4D
MATPAGAALLRFLASGDRGRAILLLVRPYSAPELMFQAWVLAMRRTFSREVDSQRVSAYLQGVIDRRGGPVPASHVAELVDLAFNNSQAASRRVKKHLAPVLLDLVRSEFPSGERRAELVHAAEVRVARLRRKSRKRPTREGRVVSSPTGGPTSVVGQILKAQAAYDGELLSSLPDEESGQAAWDVVGRAVVAVLRQRFPQSPSAELMAQFAARTASSSQDVRLDRVLAETVVRDALLVRPTDAFDAPDDLVLHTKIMAFVQAVEDLGLYSWEVDRIIRAAERAAEEAGVRLTAMP